MRIFKTVNDNKIESFYLICHNHDDKYQAVAFPWGRIDHRMFDTEEEVFDYISELVKDARGSRSEWTAIHYEEIEIKR